MGFSQTLGDLAKTYQVTSMPEMHENGRNARLVLEATMAKVEQKLDMLLKAVAFVLMGKNWDQPLGEPMSLKEGAKENPDATQSIWFQRRVFDFSIYQCFTNSGIIIPLK